jgi:hypothetical protein
MQPNGFITPPVPQPPPDSQHRSLPSRKPNPRERWDQPQQRRQEQIPTSTQYPGPLHTRPSGMATRHLVPPVTTTQPIVDFQNTPSRAVPSREGYNHDPQHHFRPPIPTPAPPPVQLPASGHERYNQGNIVHPSRERYDLQRDLHPPTPAPPPPAQLPVGGHERYNHSNIVHPSREGYNYDLQRQLYPPTPAPSLPPAQLPAERYNHGNTVHSSREGYNDHLQRDLYTAVPAPPPPRAQLSAGGHERYDHGHPLREGTSHLQHHLQPPVTAQAPPPAQLLAGGPIVNPSREGYIHGHPQDLHPPVPAPLPPLAQYPAGGHERYNQNNMVHPLNPEPIHRVDVPPPTPTGQLRPSRDRDAQSTQQSLTSNGSTFNSRNGAMPQPPRHLPKKLIMPAPLQSSLPVSPRDQSHLPLPHYRSDVRSRPQHFPSRPSSPPSSLRPSFNSLVPRAQEIPMSQGRKLRKRNSVSGLSMSAGNEPQVSFSANVGYSEPRPPAPAPAPAPSKTVKVHKRLLSKRKSDL